MARNIYFTVGPSKLYSTVPAHLARALEEDATSISHRGEAFQGFYRRAASNVRQLLGVPAEYRLYFLSSATEAMERSIQNCVRQKSFHYVNGSFSGKFHETALGLKKEAVKHDADTVAKLAVDPPEDAELVAFTQNETSTGIAVPLERIAAIRARRPDALIAVDIVSSVPSLKLDFGTVDLAFFSVQKGFGLPAGLGVLIVSPRALEKALRLADEGENVSWYHSFAELEKYASKDQTHETPNVLDIYLLGNVAGDMLHEGIDSIRERTDQRARELYAFMLGKSDRFTSTIPEEVLRSKTTASFAARGGSAPIIAALKKVGVIIGAGYGKQKETHIRIGNFPAHTSDDFQALFEAIERIG